MSKKNDDIPEFENNLNSAFQQTAQQKYSNTGIPDNVVKNASNTYSATSSTPNATVSAINDSPSSTDSIGFTPFVTALSRLISHPETKTPLTIGLYGPWGSGKSSFIEQVQGDINKNKKPIRQIDFNAWKHDASENLWVVFLQSLFVQLETPLGFFEKYKMRFLSLLQATNKLNLAINSLLFIGVIVYFGAFLAPNINEAFLNKNEAEPVLKALIKSSPGWLSSIIILGFLSPSVFNSVTKLFMPIGVNLSRLISGRNFKESVESIEGFRECFSSLIKLYLGKELRLVVYIDDLDRCSPDNAVAVIETINILLGIEKTIFILGIDRDKLTLSVEAKYKDLLELDYNQQQWNKNNKSLINNKHRYGELFMEKMIQLPISVPHPGAEDIRKFAHNLIENSDKSEIIHTDKKAVEIKQLTDENVEFIEPVKQSLINIIELLERNPRGIKRFYNTYRFVHFLYILNSDEFAGLNELALPYWYFIYYQYGDKIAHAYRDLVWNRPDEKDRSLKQFFADVENIIPELKDFFIKVDAKNSDWAVIYNSGRPVRSYYRLTRAIFY